MTDFTNEKVSNIKISQIIQPDSTVLPRKNPGYPTDQPASRCAHASDENKGKIKAKPLRPIILARHGTPDQLWALLGYVWIDRDLLDGDSETFPTRQAAEDDWFVRKFATTAAKLPRTPDTAAFIASINRFDLSVEGPSMAAREASLARLSDLALISALKQAESKRLHGQYLTLTRGVSERDKAALADAGLEFVGRAGGQLIVGVN